MVNALCFSKRLHIETAKRREMFTSQKITNDNRFVQRVGLMQKNTMQVVSGLMYLFIALGIENDLQNTC